MAFPIWNSVWAQPLSATEKLVLLCYANFANAEQNFRAWPSPRTVCRHCSISKRTLQRARATLQADGYLVRVRGEEIAGKPVFIVYPHGAETVDNVVQINGR